MTTMPQEPPAAYHASPAYESSPTDKQHGYDEKAMSAGDQSHDYEAGEGEARNLKRDLQGRHMQMIAIGGAIGAGLFVGSGGALSTGGPASLVLGFIIIGLMLLLTMQALAELGVLYPVNGAFFQYNLRFINRSWGFATGWDYAIQWLTVLPFEITAAGITLQFWQGAQDVNLGVWIAVFLVALALVQLFGVRGYGEVEFVLSVIKILALTGFIIFGIILDCGGVPGTPYIGARYWYEPGAFRNGFQGFCSVFVTASFAFGGTELTGLAAAEAANPLKSIPQATKQVFWRIAIFYVVSLLIVGLVVSSDSEFLLHASGAHTAYSPFVVAIQNAGVKGLPSVFNAVICLSVLSVANSCAFASTRTMQALAAEGMAPKFLAYIDKNGRPVASIIVQLLFGLLAFVGEANSEAKTQFFGWLLALSGLANFFIWGSICLAHIRFRAGWKAQGRTLDQIPYKAAFGVAGSWCALVLVCLCLAASFYVSLFPVGGPNLDPMGFFQNYLAAPLIFVLYIGWMLWTREWRLFIRAEDMDVTSGMRANLEELKEMSYEVEAEKTWANLPMRVVRALI